MATRWHILGHYINNAVSTYFVWLVWTASSWWWWPGAPCPWKYSCHSSMLSQCPGQWEAAVLTIDPSEALTWCPPASWSRARPWWGTEWPGGPPAWDWWDWSPGPGHLITSTQSDALIAGCGLRKYFGMSVCPVVQDSVDSYLLASNQIEKYYNSWICLKKPGP